MGMSLKAPLTVQDDSLYIGPAKIAAMPKIVWERD